MKLKSLAGLVLFILFTGPDIALGQDNWPKEIPLQSGGKIIVYQPQPESLQGNLLASRSAISVREQPDSEPVFGAIWGEAQLLTDKDSRTATLETVVITEVRFPNVADDKKIDALKTLLSSAFINWGLEINIDELVATLDQGGNIQDGQLSTSPPEIMYVDTPSTLVLLDGEPNVEKNEDLNMETVVNTPFFIVKNPDDKQYYLYGGYFWYRSASIKSGWQPVASLSGTMKELDAAMKEQMADNEQTLPEEDRPATPPQLVVSTTPAELIQSDGEADFKSIKGTALLYMANSSNDILMDISSQNYYVLLSGRWYSSTSLTGKWDYVPSDQLPADFAKVPKGSDKDGILASVAGTQEAKEATLDAQIPQTAKVDRNSTSCTVEYDGTPQFETIEGTSLQVAINTSATVIRSSNTYFAVENGVWFVSNNANGPWKVSTERPVEVDDIPPSSTAYNTKYVHIYDVTPNYVYMGYTPGYLGCYVYGPTVVYGTGYYYRPWYGSYYYPRPVTWGFGMHYNPWTGWNMGFGFSAGFFSFGFHGGYGGYGRYGGWWGPPMYRPPYRPPYYRHHGYYGNNRYRRGDINIDNSTNINIGNGTNIGNRPANNLYKLRNDATTKTRPATRDIANRKPGTKDVSRPANRPSAGDRTKPASRPGNNVNTADLGNKMNARPSARPTTGKNNVYSDKSGNIYKRNNNGNWQQRSNSGWQKSNSNATRNLNQQSSMRNRGQTRTQNYNRSRSMPSRSTPRRSRR